MIIRTTVRRSHVLIRLEEKKKKKIHCARNTNLTAAVNFLVNYILFFCAGLQPQLQRSMMHDGSLSLARFPALRPCHFKSPLPHIPTESVSSTTSFLQSIWKKKVISKFSSSFVQT